VEAKGGHAWGFEMVLEKKKPPKPTLCGTKKGGITKRGKPRGVRGRKKKEKCQGISTKRIGTVTSRKITSHARMKKKGDNISRDLREEKKQ